MSVFLDREYTNRQNPFEENIQASQSDDNAITGCIKLRLMYIDMIVLTVVRSVPVPHNNINFIKALERVIVLLLRHL